MRETPNVINNKKKKVGRVSSPQISKRGIYIKNVVCLQA
jgi:hypothetical protein